MRLCNAGTTWPRGWPAYLLIPRLVPSYGQPCRSLYHPLRCTERPALVRKRCVARGAAGQSIARLSPRPTAALRLHIGSCFRSAECADLLPSARQSSSDPNPTLPIPLLARSDAILSRLNAARSRKSRQGFTADECASVRRRLPLRLHSWFHPVSFEFVPQQAHRRGVHLVFKNRVPGGLARPRE